MKIKILKCSDSRLWYNKYIGETFDVAYRTREYSEVCYWVREGLEYNCLNFVKQIDCEEINAKD